jgi:hypothetical protein
VLSRRCCFVESRGRVFGVCFAFVSIKNSLGSRRAVAPNFYFASSDLQAAVRAGVK